ncbi:MAG: nucleotidyltransferase family protein [Amphiplicatus sp.]
MHPAIESKRKETEEICRRRGVVRLEIFGSAARGDDFDAEKSDADFLAAFKPDAGKPWMGEYMDLQTELESLPGRKVDLISLSGFKEMRNRFRRRSIEEDRELFYEA